MSDTIYFGGGCFWCIEAVFQRVPGVINVTSGYAGGHVEHPTDKDIYSGTSGHAEVVKVEYDTAKSTLDYLLAIFFYAHDPTSLNKQMNDVGEQYRSIIFFTSDSQETEIKKFIGKIQSTYDKPIVTKVEKLTQFYSASDYHQNYFNTNSNKPYCQLIIIPKLEKVLEHFNLK